MSFSPLSIDARADLAHTLRTGFFARFRDKRILSMACPNHPGITDGLNPCWRCRKTFCPNCTIELRDHLFCDGCKTAQVRDILAGTDTFSLDYASMEKRIAGWLIDGIVKVFLYLAVFIGGVAISSGINAFTQNNPNDPNKSVLFFIFLAPVVSNFYEGAMLAFNDGQSLGKLATGIRVVDSFGNPIKLRHALIRSATKYVLFFATCGSICISPVLSGMFDGLFMLGYERASLHDLFAKTRVIEAD